VNANRWEPVVEDARFRKASVTTGVTVFDLVVGDFNGDGKPDLAYTGDLEFVHNELYPVFADMISWHVRGTRYGIKVDSSGLLSSGEPGVQLTWMDARVGDWVVTPRRGKPVEIQALWYNALCVMEDLAQRFGDEAGQKRYLNMARLRVGLQSPLLE
jgi:hypothetical protein